MFTCVVLGVTLVVMSRGGVVMATTRRKLTIEIVKQDFADKGLVLLATKYTNSITRMPYICSCGRTAEITYGNFYNGKRCAGCGGTEKFDFNVAKKTFSDVGCVLLAKKYVNCRTKMPYICSCGRRAVIDLLHFKRGQRCRKCGVENQHRPNQYTFDFVKKFFENNDCTLLATEYINCFTSMPYICDCGRNAEINFHHFQNGRRCGCRRKGPMSFTFDFVKEYFESQDCTLLATEYVNNEIKMPYICSCGDAAEIRFGSFKQGVRCMNCAGDRLAKCQRHDYEYVKLYFETQGCVLLEDEYFNVKLPMSYICECGLQDQIAFQSFQRGGRCKKCWRRKAGDAHRTTSRLWKEADLDVDLKKLLRERINNGT